MSGSDFAVKTVDGGERFELNDPAAMPRAAGFLWNRQMMVQVNCRGFVVAQYMQPEPAKYTYAPNLEAKTFMQPEQPYYSHHPGRFVYIKDEETAELFSVPYEPVRRQLEGFCFSVGKSDIRWRIQHAGIEVNWQVTLAAEDVVELWQLSVRNISDRPRRLSIYPYFPIGYMSWMNQSAHYSDELGGLVASAVTPYQKVEDYFKNRSLKDETFVLHDRRPDAYEACREAFEGEGGLHAPSALTAEKLGDGDALYESPVAAFQYRVALDPGGRENYRFLLGPALDEGEVAGKRRYFDDGDFLQTRTAYSAYIAKGKGCLELETPDPHFDAFVNHWLPRQVYYHGDVNRLSTDPQTRNYLQDNMGMSYIAPAVTRAAFLQALSQQEASGAMPDGILLREGAELKYINQIPHTDHCVWLPVCLRAYLDETNDYAILNEPVAGRDGSGTASVFERIGRAMNWLLQTRDQRGLSYIAQGDWCDPMNMAGYKGKGVSGWLSVATAYAFSLWADICDERGQQEDAMRFRAGADEVNAAVNLYLWDGNWYGRGISDEGAHFGVSRDAEGRIFLNPQSWAILAHTADPAKTKALVAAIEQQLETPYGPMMLAPAYTAMREDVGRVTQKFPGSGENGSVYNHAAAFYIYSLYQIKESDRAFRLITQMLPGPEDADYRQRGQMPVYVPNYYRGAYYQFPRTAGRSSQLFNTGTAAWLYRTITEGLFGLRGDREGLRIDPQLPSHWRSARVLRSFRGATFEIHYQRDETVGVVEVYQDGELLPDPHIRGFTTGGRYKLSVRLPVKPSTKGIRT